MKTVFVLIALALASPTRAANTCQVLNGNKLVPNGGKAAKLDMPCKYVAVKQQCGGYFVKVTPGSIYVAPRFFTNTVWVEVRDAQGNSWEGRTATKIAAKYINDAGTARKAFVKVKGNLATDSVLTFSKTDNDITATATDGSFSVTFGPYDPTGSRHRNVDFTFTCNADDTPPAFPEQICGGEDKKDVQYMAEELGFKPGQKFKPHMRDQTYYYAIFTDVETDQTPNPQCREVAETMVNVCPDDAKRKEAIEKCYMILYSKPHRECATKYSCDIMDVFTNCIKFVCSDFQDDEACEAVGAAIDMCRPFPGLSDEIKKCYKDLFIVIDPNSKFYRK